MKMFRLILGLLLLPVCVAATRALIVALSVAYPRPSTLTPKCLSAPQNCWHLPVP